MTSWYVYIILTEKNRLYTGISTDPERRFIEHLCDKKKRAKFFHSDIPQKIVYLEECLNYSSALKKEIAIKKLSAINKRKIIENYSKSSESSNSSSVQDEVNS